MKKSKDNREKFVSDTEEELNCQDPEDLDEEDKNCSTCANTDCPAYQFMCQLLICIKLAEQINDNTIYNILLTIFAVLQHYNTHGSELDKILKTCQEVYINIRPGEILSALN